MNFEEVAAEKTRIERILKQAIAEVGERNEIARAHVGILHALLALNLAGCWDETLKLLGYSANLSLEAVTAAEKAAAATRVM